MKISIIGTAGKNARSHERAMLDKNLFIKMAQAALDIFPKDNHLLVSSGTAYAEHIAIWLFLNGPNLKMQNTLHIHLPSLFDLEQKRFYGNTDADVANLYHRYFTWRTGINSLGEIAQALQMESCTHTISNGFKEWNLLVGNTDLLIAFTFGADGMPDTHGTRHTWMHSTAQQKIHIPIQSL